MQEHPATWSSNAEFLEMSETVSHLLVVNDAAERGIGMIKNYNSLITQQKEQKQFLLQVLEDHYKKLPILSKSNIAAELQK